MIRRYMKPKKILAVVLTVVLVSSIGMTAFAGQWKQQVTGYHQMGYVYENSDGTYTKNGWQWIDGKCYYFDENGIMLSNTTTPDGYTVDSSGAWTVNGVVQTQKVQNQTVAYDSAHPLAGKIDEWNLRLTDNKYSNYICNNNVQAMLTGQMDKYFAPPVGEYTTPKGDKVYTTQEDYDSDRATEQALYNWFCAWLNGMDFQNMSEMQRAQEIQKVINSCSYDTVYANSSRSGRNSYLTVLVDKKGICGEFADTAKALAKAIGLSSASYGNGDHETYFIKVDGVIYVGSNNLFNLVTTYDNTNGSFYLTFD